MQKKNTSAAEAVYGFCIYRISAFPQKQLPLKRVFFGLMAHIHRSKEKKLKSHRFRNILPDTLRLPLRNRRFVKGAKPRKIPKRPTRSHTAALKAAAKGIPLPLIFFAPNPERE